MVNKNLLLARLERLREYLDILENIKIYDCARFMEDPSSMVPQKETSTSP